jgi:tRNA acetyltransferase TAN1
MKLFPGLLVSCPRNLEKACISEMIYTLVEHLNYSRKHIKAHLTGITGLVNIRLEQPIDIDETLQKLIDLEADSAFYVHSLKIKPIQKVVHASYEDLRENIPELVAKMEGAFKIEVAKRHTNMSSSMIIEAVASLISNPVNLSKPDWTILIEIIGDKAGISVIKPKFIYSTKKAKLIQEPDDWFLE